MKIITIGKYGALGNNFFRFVHACSYARDQNVELFYSDRKNIDKIFKVDGNYIQHKTTPWILNRDVLRRLLRRMAKSPRMVNVLNKFNIFIHDHINIVQKDEQLALARRRENSRLFVVRDFRAHNILSKDVDNMRKAFDLKPELTRNVDLEFQELRRKYKTLIGVHVRRGDYMEWRNGKYFFSDESFAKKVKAFISHKGFSNHEVGIIICSNGAPLIENFSGLHVFYSPRPEQDDLFLMKRCDFIIAPPSTFCSMSSFIGSVPLYFMEDDETMDFEERLHICSY